MKKDTIKKIIDNKLLYISPNTNEAEWVLLKNNSRTPIFLDTSKFISFPDLLQEVNQMIIEIIKEKTINFDKIIGIPYGGLPFSYGVSCLLKAPGLSIRKEGFKNYSTKGELLGNYQKGDEVLIIEDATVTANTVIEFINKLKDSGLKISHVITVLDIEKSARENLAKLGVNLYPLFTWKELYESYKIERPKFINQDMENFLDKFINN
ncbi:MAG: phosphoribosyltransferase family protein [Candidatus Falkowbacteria bacterium]